MHLIDLSLPAGFDGLRAAALSIGILVAGFATFRLVFGRLVRWLYRAQPEQARLVLGRLALAFLPLLLLLSANAFRGSFGKQADWWLGALLAPAIALFAVETLRHCVADYLLRARSGPAVPKILRDMAFGLVYAVSGLTYLGTVFKVDLTPLLTTSAILSVVIGMALQETLGNLFSGIAINLDRPFNLGDWVAIDGDQGRVVEITWRATKIMVRGGEMLIIPNNTLSKAKVLNYRQTAPAYYENIELGLPYDAPPNRLRQLALEVAAAVPEIRTAPAPRVDLLQYGDSAIVYRFRFWMDDCTQAIPVRSAFLEGLWYRLHREGIAIPFPTRTVHLEDARARSSEAEAANLRALRKVDIVACMDPDSIHALAAKAQAHHYAPGERIFAQGDVGDSLYVIKAGTVTLSLAESGEARSLATLREGDFFGEMSLLTGERRSASADAATDCELLVIDRRHLAPLLEAHPEFMRRISQTIAARRQDTESIIASLAEAREATVPQAAPAEVEATSNEIFNRIRSFFKLT